MSVWEAPKLGRAPFRWLRVPLPSSTAALRTSMAPSKGMIEELANIDQRLSALEAKFDSFSNEQKDGSNKRKKPARKNERECTYCKKAGKWFQGHEESEYHHKKKDEAEAAFKPSRRGVSAQARDAKRLRVRRKPSRLVLLLIKDPGVGW